MCRVLIDPNTYDQDALFGSLDKHHIWYFSEGGGDTYENLMLVCANCHRKIHRDKIPPDELRQKKLHWVNMRDVVPCHRDSAWPDACVLHITPDGSPRHDMPLRPVDFVLESVNLQYRLMLSESDPVWMVAGFVKSGILQPLGQYDHNQNWTRADKVWLAPRRMPELRLKQNLRFGDDKLADVQELVGIIAVSVMAAFPSEGHELISPEKVAEIIWQQRLRFPDYLFPVEQTAKATASLITEPIVEKLKQQLPSLLLARSYLIGEAERVLNDFIQNELSLILDPAYKVQTPQAIWRVSRAVSDALSMVGGGLQL